MVIQVFTASSRVLCVPPGVFHSFLPPMPRSPLPSGWQVLQELPDVPPPSFGSLNRVLPRSSGRCFIANAADVTRAMATRNNTAIFKIFIRIHLLSARKYERIQKMESFEFSEHY